MGDWLEAATWPALLGALGAVFVLLTAFSVGMGYVYERTSKERRIWNVKLKRGQIRRELIGTAVFLLLFVPSLTAAIASGALVFRASSWRSEVVTFLVCWWSFQWFYWFLHRAMHHPRLFFTHRWHHDSLVTTPLTGLSMSPWEAVGWIVCLIAPAIVLAQVWELGVWGLTVFFAANWYGNITGHANAEFLPRFFGTRAASAISGNVVFHALHHARFDGHYGFGTALQDRVFGTEFEDWRSLHTKVCDGAPMQSLRERGAASSTAG